MDWEKKSVQVGAAVLCGAVLVRLLGGGMGLRGLEKKKMEKLAQTIFFMETGLRPGPPTQPPETTEPTSSPPPSEPEPLEIDPQQADGLQVFNFCRKELDLQAMAVQPLSWNLRQPEPSVLIYHTHATESYENTDGHRELEPYRSDDPDSSVIAVGKALKESLEAQGISVIHDTTLHDLKSYNASYGESRKTAEAWLEKVPSLQLVLDIHRDAAEDAQGNQVSHRVSVGDREGAMIMVVAGTDAGGDPHPHWKDNAALAVKLQLMLDQTAPGIARPICFRGSRFNQDLSPGALLIEVGTAGNTLEEALVSAQVLGQAIGALADGTTPGEQLH